MKRLICLSKGRGGQYWSCSWYGSLAKSELFLDENGIVDFDEQYYEGLMLAVLIFDEHFQKLAGFSSIRPIIDELNNLVSSNCKLKESSFEIMNDPSNEWHTRILDILDKIDPDLAKKGLQFNTDLLKKSDLLEDFFSNNIVLDDDYIKIFVNPFLNKIPPIFMEEIRHSLITLPRFADKSNKYYK